MDYDCGLKMSKEVHVYGHSCVPFPGNRTVEE